MKTWANGGGGVSATALMAAVSGRAEFARTGATVKQKNDRVQRFLQRLYGFTEYLQLGGTRDAGISTAVPLRGLRPIREARWMTEKLPKPLISMRCPRTIALFIASKMVETAVSASPCVS